MQTTAWFKKTKKKRDGTSGVDVVDFTLHIMRAAQYHPLSIVLELLLLYSFLTLLFWIYLSNVEIDSRCAHEIAK